MWHTLGFLYRELFLKTVPRLALETSSALNSQSNDNNSVIVTTK